MAGSSCWRGVVGLVVAATALSTCASEASPRTEVSPAEAYTAIVRWEVGVVDDEPDDPDEELQVIYLTSSSGSTIDVRTQAEVVDAMSAIAVVRFADRSEDTLDLGVESMPVKDDGVMFVADEIPEGSAAFDLTVQRYRDVDDDVTYRMQLAASDVGARVVDATEQPN